VCVVGKNYRLQDIQLSKNFFNRGSAPNPGSVARGSLPAPLPRRRAVRAYCRIFSLTRSRGRNALLRSFALSANQLDRLAVRKFFKDRRRLAATKCLEPACCSRADAIGAGEAARLNVAPSILENTGLEPVTSWLQTRRSPS
jgi:hypothetical protein